MWLKTLHGELINTNYFSNIVVEYCPGSFKYCPGSFAVVAYGKRADNLVLKHQLTPFEEFEDAQNYLDELLEKLNS